MWPAPDLSHRYFRVSFAWTGQLLERRHALIARNIARLDTGEMLENPVGPPATAGAA